MFAQQLAGLPHSASDWHQKFDTHFGVPDRDSSKTVGAAYEHWAHVNKALIDKHDYEGCLKAIGELHTALKAYQKDFGKIKSPDYTCKAEDKAGNYNKASAKLTEMIGAVAKLEETFKGLVKTEGTFKKDLDDTRDAFEVLADLNAEFLGICHDTLVRLTGKQKLQDALTKLQGETKQLQPHVKDHAKATLQFNAQAHTVEQFAGMAKLGEDATRKYLEDYDKLVAVLKAILGHK